MIARYTHPEMGRIWSDQRRYETWLRVEIAAAEAMASAGIVPREAARDIRELGAFDIARIEAIEETRQHVDLDGEPVGSSEDSNHLRLPNGSEGHNNALDPLLADHFLQLGGVAYEWDR